MRTNRQGAPQLMWIVVIAMIFLVLAAVVILGFSGNWRGFESYIGNNIAGADRDTCDTRVNSFCGRDGNDGEDWTERYPECADYVGEIRDEEKC